MTGKAGASNPLVRNPIRPTPQVARSAPTTHSQGGDTGSNPIGLRGTMAANDPPYRSLPDVLPDHLLEGRQRIAARSRDHNGKRLAV
jgi:hypothetical protein